MGEDFDAAVEFLGQAVDLGAVIAAVWLVMAFLLACTLGAVRRRDEDDDDGA